MMPKLIVCFFSLFLIASTQGQFSFNCTKNITLPCNQACVRLTTKIPAINAYSNQYTVNKTDCFRPNISPAIPGVSTNLGRDDWYTPAIPIPFLFSFYGIYYLNTIVNTNGALSFDLANSDQIAPCVIQGQDGSLPSSDYDRAVIMGSFHDVDISQSQSPSRQIKYDVVGLAPQRKWVISFYKVPCYDCQDKINNTYQISLYEGLSIVEVHVFEREVCTFWNSGAAMIGMQNYERNSGIMAPGRSAFTSPRWQGLQMNEAWRFVPAAGPSLLKKVELYKSTGEFVATGDTVNNNTGTYSVSFNNICPDSAFVQYIVKSAYYNIEYPFQFPARDSVIYAFDTINVDRNGQFTYVRYPKNIYCNTENLQETPLVAGVGGGIFSTDVPGLSIDSISGVINISASNPGLYTIKYQITTSDSCIIPTASATVRIVDSTQFVWTGAVDNTWENPANWSCNNLPVNTSNVIIYSGNVVINSNITINKLTIMPGVNLTVNPGVNLTILNP